MSVRPTRAYLAEFFTYGFALAVEIEIVGAAGFGVCSGHIEAAEGMAAYDGAGALDRKSVV